jgi:phosphate transport system substrate-binding protein
MQKKLFSSLLFLVLILASASYAAAREKITICGTGDSQELLRLLAAEFGKHHPDIQVAVPDSIGSSGGIKATAKGKCDLGRVARPLKEKEKKYRLFSMFFAKSPVVFFGNSSLKNISSLTAKQVIDIYSGNTILWQDVSEITGKIYVANREAGDSSRSVIEKHIPAFKAIKQFAGETLYSTPETVETVLSHDHTIGYTALSALIGRDNSHIFHFNGIRPDESSVSDGSYPLVSTYGLVWRQDISPPAVKFIDFLSTPEARKVILTSGTYLASQK